MPIGPSGVSASLSGVTVTGTAASGNVPVASSATAAAWQFPPGYEISYTQITSPVNIASSTESSGTAIISPAAATFDGGAVLVEVFAVIQGGSVATQEQICLFEATTQITRLGALAQSAASTGFFQATTWKYRFTPTAGSHTYTVTAFANNTTGTQASVQCGSGGTGGLPPAFIRFTKV